MSDAQPSLTPYQSTVMQHIDTHMSGGGAALMDGAGNSILRYEDAPFVGATSFVSCAANQPISAMEDRGQQSHISQELVFAIKTQQCNDQTVQVFAALMEWLREQDAAFRYGEVIGPLDALFPDTDKQSLYVAMPTYFEEELAFCHATQPPTMFVWLVPVTEAERKYIVENGSDAFEVLLDEKNPDATDLKRACLV